MKKYLLIAAVLLLSVGCDDAIENNPVATPPVDVSKTFTMAEVQAANTESNCYSVVDGKVYNLTGAMNKHEGGKEAILSMCGKDATTGFKEQHGGQKKPENMLTGLQIGVLAK